ncbi:MAG: PAS domain S-box protein [Methanomicrobiaceae archaeon]|nr:PAS domain S-box protein [Methanomicrobiaceae archaeon]
MTGERILIVEDDAILAMHLTDILTAYGYQIDPPLATGEKAVEQANKNPPDIILMDIRLPGDMNGIEAAEEIKKTRDIPVVYLTAYSDPKLINKAKLTEPYAYLVKPVPDIEVHTTVEMALYKHRVDSKLRESEDKFRNVFDWANDAIFLHNLSNDKAPGHFIEVNRVACEMLGYSREEMLAMGPPDIVPAELHPQLKKIVRQAQTEKKFIFETRFLRKDGSTFPVESSAILVDYNNEKTWISHIRDITDRKQAEKKLRESEERFRQIAESAGEWIWEVDPDGLYTYASPVVEKLLGYKPEELVGNMHFYDLFSPEVREDMKKAAMEAFAAQEPFTGFFNINLHKNGNHVILETSGVPNYEETGRFIGYRGADTDVTERCRVEEELRKSEEQYRNLVENISDIIFSMDFNGIITYISPIVEKTYGYSPDEVTGQQFTRFIHPDDLPGVLEGFQRRIKGEYGENIFRLIGKDGSEHYVRTNQTPIILEGKVTGFNYVMTDFTERKTAEIGLREANKKLNMLSSITRHDILNMIMVIRGYLELSDDVEKDPIMQGYIEKEKEAVDTIQHQIEFTRYYQEIGLKEPIWQNAGKLANSVADALDLEGIKFENLLNGLEVFADPLIGRVFYNLTENSIRHGGHVTSIGFSYSEKEDGIVISYHDNGIGISKEDKNKLFIKGFGKHTGLGLFLSREILSITNIEISENGTEGDGVNFEITVPKGNFRFIT